MYATLTERRGQQKEVTLALSSKLDATSNIVTRNLLYSTYATLIITIFQNQYWMFQCLRDKMIMLNLAYEFKDFK